MLFKYFNIQSNSHQTDIMSDEGSDKVDNSEEEESRASVVEDNTFIIEDANTDEISQELLDVEEETRKHKQQAGEKENRKDDKTHEPPTKRNPMWKGDRLFPLA